MPEPPGFGQYVYYGTWQRADGTWWTGCEGCDHAKAGRLMPETPDFDQIARDICQRIWGNDVLESREHVSHTIAEQLRLVWNARGAADVDLFAGEMDHRDIRERITTLDR